MELSRKLLNLFGGKLDTRSSPEKLFYLSTVDIFQDLKPDQMHEVERATAMITCPAGRVFYTPNETGEIMFILKKGRVQLYRMSSEGRKLIIGNLGPGTVFGEMILTGQGMYDAFAETVEDSLICIMKRRDIEKLLLERPQIAIRLLGLVGSRLQQVEERLEETLFHEVPSRLAATLLRLQSDEGSSVLQITHEALAEQLGVYRETVTTALNNLQRERLIALGRRRVELLDPAGLKKRAEM